MAKRTNKSIALQTPMVRPESASRFFHTVEPQAPLSTECRSHFSMYDIYSMRRGVTREWERGMIDVKTARIKEAK